MDPTAERIRLVLGEIMHRMDRHDGSVAEHYWKYITLNRHMSMYDVWSKFAKRAIQRREHPRGESRPLVEMPSGNIRLRQAAFHGAVRCRKQAHCAYSVRFGQSNH